LSYASVQGASAGEVRHLYLNVPTSVGFFGAVVGGDLIGKTRDLSLNADGTTHMQTGVGGWVPDVSGRAINQDDASEKRIALRVLGPRSLDMSVSAKGQMTGYLLRNGWESNDYPHMVGRFSAGGTDVAVREEVNPPCRPGGSSLKCDRGVDATFEGTGTIPSKSATTIDLVGGVTVQLRALGRGGVTRMNGNASLVLQKLQLTITNPGDR
jgi:hypothetical protein